MGRALHDDSLRALGATEKLESGFPNRTAGIVGRSTAELLISCVDGIIT